MEQTDRIDSNDTPVGGFIQTYKDHVFLGFFLGAFLAFVLIFVFDLIPAQPNYGIIYEKYQIEERTLLDKTGEHYLIQVTYEKKHMVKMCGDMGNCREFPVTEEEYNSIDTGDYYEYRRSE